MSALGQKQTRALQNGISALPPEADICGAKRNVRFGPEADIEDAKRETASPAVSPKLDKVCRSGGCDYSTFGGLKNTAIQPVKQPG